jgi:NADPH:quinone reductase-like Zn-dependent oxidoreductase
VLIHSAAGGVGLAAIQLGKTRDCVMIGSASKTKHDFLREQGCQYPIDSAGELKSQTRAVLASIGATGVDLVLDAVGGASWTDGYDLLDPCGRLVAFGLSAANSGTTRNVFHALTQVLRVKRYSPMKLMDDNKSVTGVNMGHLFGRLDLLRPQFEALLELYVAGKIKPRVDKTFPFDRAGEAHQFIHDRKAIGKVLLTPT